VREKESFFYPTRIDGFRSLLIRSQKVGLHRDSTFASLMVHLEANPEDNEMHDLALERIEEVEMQNLVDPDPFRATNPISPRDLQGNIGLGHIPTSGIPWLISPAMLTNHILICGRSGGGKTNLILLILAQLLEMQKC